MRRLLNNSKISISEANELWGLVSFILESYDENPYGCFSDSHESPTLKASGFSDDKIDIGGGFACM